MKKLLFTMAAASAISAFLCLHGYAEEAVKEEGYVTAIVEAVSTAREALNTSEDNNAVSGNENRNTGYRISNTWAEKDAAGYKDWAVQKLDIPSVTIECGIGTSPVAESQIEEMWAGNDGILPDIMIDLVNK